MTHATDNKLALLNTYYVTPARSISYTFQSPNRGTAQYRSFYILTRQVDRRLVRNVTVWTPPRDNGEPDLNLVPGNFRSLGRIAPNRPKIVIKNRRAIDLQRLMADPHLRMNLKNAIAAYLASPTPGTNAGSVDDMASLLTETILTVKCRRHSAPYSAQTSAEGLVCDRGGERELNARWQDREDARKRVRSAPNDVIWRVAAHARSTLLRSSCGLYRCML